MARLKAKRAFFDSVLGKIRKNEEFDGDPQFYRSLASEIKRRAAKRPDNDSKPADDKG